MMVLSILHPPPRSAILRRMADLDLREEIARIDWARAALRSARSVRDVPASWLPVVAGMILGAAVFAAGMAVGGLLVR